MQIQFKVDSFPDVPMCFYIDERDRITLSISPLIWQEMKIRSHFKTFSPIQITLDKDYYPLSPLETSVSFVDSPKMRKKNKSEYLVEVISVLNYIVSEWRKQFLPMMNTLTITLIQEISQLREQIDSLEYKVVERCESRDY